MWDDHYCRSAKQRVNAMAPRMNQVLTAARAHGVQIIHAPSGTMKTYESTEFRKRMQQAPKAEPPVPIQPWCKLDPSREAPLPIDDSDGGCDDPIPPPAVGNYQHQHPAIDMVGPDGISDSGVEIYNFFRQEGIKNVVLMGVHTNMCVLGRPFGIRQQRLLGMNVVLARDLTDAMYNPRRAPFVSHTRGTELVIEHIEKYWCPSILSDDLTRVMPGSADPATVGTSGDTSNRRK
jgi:nicotinamidase-related amidase